MVLGATSPHVELVRRAYDAWNANDWDALGEIYHADIKVTSPPGFMEPGEYHGWPALRQRYREVKSAWQDESIELVDVSAEADMVAARVKWFGLGRSSEAPISLDVTNLVEVRSDRIFRLEYFWDYEEAVAAMHERVRGGERASARPEA